LGGPWPTLQHPHVLEFLLVNTCICTPNIKSCYIFFIKIFTFYCLNWCATNDREFFPVCVMYLSYWAFPCFLQQMLTDLWYGIGMDRVVKLQSEYSPTYTYVFRWKSYTDWLPWYLGKYCFCKFFFQVLVHNAWKSDTKLYSETFC